MAMGGFSQRRTERLVSFANTQEVAGHSHFQSSLIALSLRIAKRRSNVIDVAVKYPIDSRLRS